MGDAVGDIVKLLVGLRVVGITGDDAVVDDVRHSVRPKVGLIVRITVGDTIANDVGLTMGDAFGDTVGLIAGLIVASRQR